MLWYLKFILRPDKTDSLYHIIIMVTISTLFSIVNEIYI